MKSTDMLIDEDLILTIVSHLGVDGIDEAFSQLADHEPELTSYIGHNSTLMAGKLALSGAPTEIVRGVYQDTLIMVLASIQAIRTAHYELWKDAEGNEVLRKLGEPGKTPVDESSDGDARD